MTQRIDKVLSRELNISRTDAKRLLRSGDVCLNGVVVCDGAAKVTPDSKITVDGQPLAVSEFVYIMLNKPGGIVSASQSKDDVCVTDILPNDMKRRGLFPAGRLDRDSTGFVLLTDDGAFAHNILSPSHHISKTYLVGLDAPVDEKVAADFRQGMLLNGKKLLPAEVTVNPDNPSCARVILRQGVYHQIKRMFKKHGLNVVSLHRTAIGSLELDNTLAPGECRYITLDELDRLSLL